MQLKNIFTSIQATKFVLETSCWHFFKCTYIHFVQTERCYFLW